MESLKLPMREIRQKYTKSEMYIMGWRAAETAWNMEQQRNSSPPQHSRAPVIPSEHAMDDAQLKNLEARMGPTIVAKLGEDLDMRKLTGEEAMQFMMAMGIPMGGH